VRARGGAGQARRAQRVRGGECAAQVCAAIKRCSAEVKAAPAVAAGRIVRAEACGATMKQRGVRAYVSGWKGARGVIEKVVVEGEVRGA